MTTNEKPSLGCGLSYLVSLIKECYEDERKRHNKIPTRLIGVQAIAISRYAYCLIDSFHSTDDSLSQCVVCLALGRTVLFLRHTCSIFNKVSTTPVDLQELDENCKLYFNLICLFFSKSCECRCLDSWLCNSLPCLQAPQDFQDWVWNNFPASKGS